MQAEKNHFKHKTSIDLLKYYLLTVHLNPERLPWIFSFPPQREAPSLQSQVGILIFKKKVVFDF